MASLASVRLIVRNTGALRNSITRLYIQGAVTQLQLNHKLFHSIRQDPLACVPQVKVQRACMYCTAKKLSVKDIEARVLKVVAAYDKISADKLSLESHFNNDLGLDSLDHVEVIMAMEDEFGFEIPDMDAEKLLTPGHIVRYIADKEDVFD